MPDAKLPPIKLVIETDAFGNSVVRDTYSGREIECVKFAEIKYDASYGHRPVLYLEIDLGESTFIQK